MHALQLMRHLAGLTANEAELWIGAALAEAAALRQHDARLYPPADAPAAMATAAKLHDAWREWADDAEALLRLLNRDDHGGLRDLRVGIGYARCLAGMPPQEVLRRRQRVQTGNAKLYTTAEARRELGIAPRR